MEGRYSVGETGVKRQELDKNPRLANVSHLVSRPSAPVPPRPSYLSHGDAPVQSNIYIYNTILPSNLLGSLPTPLTLGNVGKQGKTRKARKGKNASDNATTS